jgi:hypothetical protein
MKLVATDRRATATVGTCSFDERLGAERRKVMNTIAFVFRAPASTSPANT